MNADNMWNEAAKWLRYAKEDLDAAESLLRDDATPRHICFMAQQSAEKAIKSVFVLLQIDFPRTHDLDALKSLLPTEWSSRLKSIDLAELSEWAVESRYPGNWAEATLDDAHSACEQARIVYDLIADAFSGMGYALP